MRIPVTILAVLASCWQYVDTRTVRLHDLCGTGSGYDSLVYKHDPVTVVIRGSDLGQGKHKCTVVFRADDTDQDLYYQFQNYRNPDHLTELRVESKNAISYSTKKRYTGYKTPTLNYANHGETYLRITLETSSQVTSGFTATMRITNRGGSSGFSNFLNLPVGTIVGAIVGIGGLITVVVVVLIFRSRARRRAMAANTAMTYPGLTSTTTTTGAYQMQPYGQPGYQPQTAAPGYQPQPYPAGYPPPTNAYGYPPPTNPSGYPPPSNAPGYPPSNNPSGYPPPSNTPGYPINPAGYPSSAQGYQPPPSYESVQGSGDAAAGEKGSSQPSAPSW